MTEDAYRLAWSDAYWNARGVGLSTCAAAAAANTAMDDLLEDLGREERLERIGRPGVAWATHYVDGWAVYSHRGLLSTGKDELAARIAVDVLLAILETEIIAP